MALQPSSISVNRNTPMWADRFGIWASALCVVHCLATPVLLSASAVFAHLLPSEERTHRCLAFTVAMLGAAALVKGFHTHRKVRVVLLMLLGLGCIFTSAFFGDSLPSHVAEVAVTMVGSVSMITAHRLNHLCCRSCGCTHHSCGAQ